MKKTVIIGAVASLCLAGSAGGAAIASTNHHAPAVHHVASGLSNGGLHVTVSPLKPARGQTVTARLTGAKKKPNYVCIQTTYKKGVKLSAGDSSTATAVLNIKAKHGKAKCHQIFLGFTTPHGHHCPPTKADKKAGWKCGVAFADPKHRSNYAVGLFKF